MQRLHVEQGSRFHLWRFPEQARGALQQLVAPLLDLVRMNVKVLGQPDRGLLPLDRRHSYLRLEGRAVAPRADVWSS